MLCKYIVNYSDNTGIVIFPSWTSIVYPSIIIVPFLTTSSTTVRLALSIVYPIVLVVIVLPSFNPFTSFT